MRLPPESKQLATLLPFTTLVRCAGGGGGTLCSGGERCKEGVPGARQCYIVYRRTQRMTVMSSTTMSLRLPTETKERLDALAKRTRRSRSFLAGEAVTAYVERELAIVEGIERGLADMRAGRVTPHDEAMRRIRRTIARAKADR